MALPTNIVAGGTGHVAHTNEVHLRTNENYDGTGWRNLASTLNSGWTATKIQIIRRGWRVSLIIRGLAATSGSGSTQIMTSLPVGFRPAAALVRYPTADNSQFIIDIGGQVVAPVTVSTPAGADIWIEWDASGTLPTTGLPGVAV